jgi:hypothetical protein
MPDPLARVLAHPLRHRLLLEYNGDPASPSEVARRLERPLALVSYHTGVLARNGFLELVRTERRRGALARVYRTTSPPYIEDEQWRDVPAAVRRELVLRILALASAEARGAALAGGFDGSASHLSRWPVELDADGVIAATGALRRLVDEIAELHERCRDRPGRRPFELVLLGFEPSAPVAPDGVD